MYEYFMPLTFDGKMSKENETQRKTANKPA